VHRYQIAGNLPFGEEHFENIMPEERLQFFSSSGGATRNSILWRYFLDMQAWLLYVHFE
jgi:hypothetical protein